MKNIQKPQNLLSFTAGKTTKKSHLATLLLLGVFAICQNLFAQQHSVYSFKKESFKYRNGIDTQISIMASTQSPNGYVYEVFYVELGYGDKVTFNGTTYTSDSSGFYMLLKFDAGGKLLKQQELFAKVYNSYILPTVSNISVNANEEVCIAWQYNGWYYYGPGICTIDKKKFYSSKPVPASFLQFMDNKWATQKIAFIAVGSGYGSYDNYGNYRCLINYDDSFMVDYKRINPNNPYGSNVRNKGILTFSTTYQLKKVDYLFNSSSSSVLFYYLNLLNSGKDFYISGNVIRGDYYYRNKRIPNPNSNNNDAQPFIMKFDSSGAFHWFKTNLPKAKNKNYNSYLYKVIQSGNSLYLIGTADDQSYILGDSSFFVTANNEDFIAKMDTSGKIGWLKLNGQGLLRYGNLYPSRDGVYYLSQGRYLDNFFGDSIKKNMVFFSEVTQKGNVQKPVIISNNYSQWIYPAIFMGGKVDDVLLTGSFNGNGSLELVNQTFKDSNNPFLYHALISPHENLSGRVYLDSNNNSSQDKNEVGLLNQTVKITSPNLSEPTYYFTTDSGNYHALLDTGSYSLSAVKKYKKAILKINPALRNSKIVDGTTNIKNQDFGVVLDTTYHDLSINSSQNSRLRINRRQGVYYALNSNSGGIETPTIIIKSVKGLMIDSCNVKGTIAGDSIVITPGKIKPFDYFYFVVYVKNKSGVSLSDSVELVARVLPMNIDSMPYNNYDTVKMKVVNSSDPNNKSVSDSVRILKYLKPLTFTINFQNTGNDTAYTIFLHDQLDDHLNPESFSLIGSSHKCNYKIINKQLRVSYQNINLPDSGANEIKSHGYFQYSISPYNTISNGTVVKNTANIYFDFNKPIITNSTNTRFGSIVSIIEKEEEPTTNNLVVYPNPTKGELSIHTKTYAKQTSVSVYNIMGQLITHEEFFNQSNMNISTSHLPKGIYLLRINADGKMFERKVIKE
ncbi:MAG: T9SS type A sorting domain-containing protein [Bacteroidetes bacterium]|nr:T9SS type A sorting domain-containing protein [Bacteroidota bacterium]